MSANLSVQYRPSEHPNTAKVWKAVISGGQGDDLAAFGTTPADALNAFFDTLLILKRFDDARLVNAAWISADDAALPY